jgi:signal transduction histidine kinase
MVDVERHAEETPLRHCPWEEELARAGITTSPALLRWGAPSIGLLPLVAAAVVALADGGERPGALGLALLALAAVPFVVWLAGADSGPSPAVAAAMIAPIAALGAVGVVAASQGLGSEPGYRLATFPLLLAVLLWVSVDARRSTAVALAAYLAVTGPVVAGWLAGRPLLTASAVVTWHLGFVFCVAAAYAVRLAYLANVQVREAREALARQEAAAQRRRVAQDVHDVVAHTLAVTMLHVTAARMAVRRSSPAEAEEALEEAERHGRSSLADIRRIVRLLRADDEPGVLATAQPGLGEVEALLESYRAAGLGVEGTVALDGAPASPTAELAVYRVVQEALANAARHGDGTATVRLSAAAGHLSVRVANPASTQPQPRRPGSSGLVGMRERVSAAGGTFEAGASDGTWVVRAEIPAAVPA